ncbi:GLD2 poly(A) polymerase [Carabus blaptoides fortunei]
MCARLKKPNLYLHHVKHDKESSSKVSDTKKPPEKKNVKCLYEKNVGVQQQLCSANNLYSLFPPHHHSGGFYNKHRYYSHRQDRCNSNKRVPHSTYSPEGQQQSRVDMLMAKFMSRSKFVEMKEMPGSVLAACEWGTLSKQIWDAFISCQQTEETYKKKLTLWQYLYTFIRNWFPRYGLYLVGSTMSGFGSNTSDVDMCLLVRPSYVDQRSEALNYLEQIQHSLKYCDFVDNIELIWAKVPILKFRDSSRHLEVDLNCNNAVGIRNTHLLHCYANIDWRVRPLVLIVKLWASANNINDAKNMTISSYSLALMVIHYLQCGVAPPVIPCLHGLYPGKFLPDSDIHSIDMQEQLIPFHSDNNQTLGELLLGFLRYFATFNYAVHAISVRLGARIPIDECRLARSHKNDPHQWKHLCIEEPFDLTNTARSVYDPQIFQRIKSVFIASHNRLERTRDLITIFQFDNIDKL